MSLAASLTTGAALYVSLSYDLSCFHTCSYIVSAMLALLTVRATYLRSFLHSISHFAAPLQYLSLSNLSTKASTFTAGSFAVSTINLTATVAIPQFPII